jgi:hypothetical protein
MPCLLRVTMMVGSPNERGACTVTRFHIYAPTCGFCGTFLTDIEREANLTCCSPVIACPSWASPIRLLCATCYHGDTRKAPASLDELNQL